LVDRIPFLSPKFPTVEEVAEDYATILERRVYSNGGPFERQLAEKLRARLGSETRVSLVANGTAGIELAIAATFLGDRTWGLVASFTFAAGPLAIRSRGYQPAFLDIDPNSWQPDLAHCERFLESHAADTAGILLTNTFGVANSAIAAWEGLAAHHGLPLVIDSAAGFGSLYPSGECLGSRGTCEVFSLHATKTMAVGEGGAVTSRDPDLISQIDQRKNFGFDELHNATVPGTNAKLSELSAAIGLRQLTALPARLATRREIFAHYRDEFSQAGVTFQPLSELSALPFVSVALPSTTLRGMTLEALDEAGIEARAYYNPPVHLQSVFASPLLASETMRHTLDLATRIISLPMSDDLTVTDVARIARVCRGVLGIE
jgi:dTDP-4-amino-4,6-dideoxygalactose transaminase